VIEENAEDFADLDYSEDSEEIKAINEVQSELTTISEATAEEVLDINFQSYLKKKPLFDRRQKCIEKVEGFWQRVLAEHQTVGRQITDEDMEALKHLTSVEVVFSDKHTFRVVLAFSPNPYFSNSSLWKEYHIVNVGDVDVTSCEVQWKSTPEAEGVKKRLIKNLDPDADQEGADEFSFFSMFDEEDKDFGIGEAFRDEIYEEPLTYFFGLGEQGDVEEEEEEEGDFDDQCEDEDS